MTVILTAIIAFFILHMIGVVGVLSCSLFGISNAPVLLK